MNLKMDKDFFELFEIPKIEYREPARVEDCNGDICEWYVTEDFPSIEPIFFDLLNIYEVQYNGNPIVINLTAFDLKNYLQEGLINLYNNSTEDIRKALKEDIQYTFKEYYGE